MLPTGRKRASQTLRARGWCLRPFHCWWRLPASGKSYGRSFWSGAEGAFSKARDLCRRLRGGVAGFPRVRTFPFRSAVEEKRHRVEIGWLFFFLTAEGVFFLSQQSSDRHVGGLPAPHFFQQSLMEKMSSKLSKLKKMMWQLINKYGDKLLPFWSLLLEYTDGDLCLSVN